MMGSDGSKSHLDRGMIKVGALQTQKDRFEDEFASVTWDQRTLFSEMNS
jgi:hypothetical protein